MMSTAYRSGRSMLHVCDPRVKLIVLMEVCVLLFWPMNLRYSGIITGIIMCTILLSLGIRDLLIPIKGISPLLILVALLTPPFYRGGEVLAAFWIIEITTYGIEETLRLIFRFTGITLIFFAYFRTVPMREVILTLRFYGLPYTAALVISLSFRYIPYIAQLLQNVQDAHSLRCSVVQEGEKPKRGIFRRFAGIQPVLTSVVIASIKSIPSLAMSLEHRGIGSTVRRSSYTQLRRLREVRHHMFLGAAAMGLLTFPFWGIC